MLCSKSKCLPPLASKLASCRQQSRRGDKSRGSRRPMLSAPRLASALTGLAQGRADLHDAARGICVKRLVQFALEAGGTVVVEVDEPGDGGLQRAGRAGEISETAAETLEAALDRIRPAAEAVVSRLGNLSQPA